ncbi:MAG TPA: DHA2 family efflux MFS transporter permease subunit [Candidatus Sulfotelmatobacter sp.]|nr:DHA2 family efflux MFS transporter permease subunit [Candidatus Sulfotelmatobacter sp.]
MPAEHAEWRPRYNPWIVAVSVMLATFMEILDTSVANVALPHIAGTLSATPEEATWVLTSYLVSNAIVLPTAAWWSGLFGRKRFLLTCILIFTVSSMLCGAATSLGLLVVARVFQGAGGGALQPIAQSVLLESFPPSRRGIAMATYGMGVVVAPIIGPTLGGWITEEYTWRWVFYINLPIGILAFLMSQAFVEDPPYIRRSRAGRIDYLGFGLMAVGLGALQIMLDKGQEEDWFSSSWICWLAAIAGVGLIGFIVRELTTDHPIVDLRIFLNRNFAVGTCLIGLLGVILYSTIAMLPLYLQLLMGYNAYLSGLTMTPRGLGAFTSNVLVGRLLVGRIDSRLVIGTGLSFLALSCWLFSHMNLSIAMSSVVWPNFLNGVATATVFVALTTTTMGMLRNEQLGNAAGMFNLMRNLGGGVGIAATTTFLARGAQVHQVYLVSHLTPSDPTMQSWLAKAQGAIQPQVGGPEAGPKTLGLLYNVVGQQAQLLAFMDNFRLVSLLAILAVPLVALFKRPKPHRAASPAH